jgi:hypothetical protein
LSVVSFHAIGVAVATSRSAERKVPFPAPLAIAATMTYDFPLMNGAVRSGSSGTSDKPPAIGGVICIVYDGELPKRNKPYPFSLVTTAL